MERATGLAAIVVLGCLLTACAVSDDDPQRSQLEPLHDTIDPEALAAPAAVPIPAPESTAVIGQWRVAEVVDGRTLVLYSGLERATATVGGITVPVDDECMAGVATDSLAFITGGGQSVTVSPPSPRQNRIEDATIVTAAGDDVAEAMLSLGLARVEQDDSTRDGDEEIEESARQQAVGLWSGVCDD